MSFLVLCFVLFLKRGSYIRSGIFYALAIHFKIYPITYGLAILFFLVNNQKSIYSYSMVNLFKSIIFNKNIYKFGISFVSTFTIITYFYYYKYKIKILIIKCKYQNVILVLFLDMVTNFCRKLIYIICQDKIFAIISALTST